MDHSAMLYVMGPDGKYVMHMRNSDSATDIQERLQKLLK
jgi:cytochrome oxidase Cu insertion factor (SCO1/SenC/PrrC family)